MTHFFLHCLALFNLPGLFDELADNLDNALPFAFYYDHHDLEKQKTITDKIKQFYFNNELTREKDLNLTNVIILGLIAQFKYILMISFESSVVW